MPDPSSASDEEAAVHAALEGAKRGELTERQALDDVEERRKAQFVDLRSGYGWGLLVLMYLQVALANGIFIYYARARQWDVPSSVMQVWLGATVVQVIGIATIVVRHLFPSK